MDKFLVFCVCFAFTAIKGCESCTPECVCSLESTTCYFGEKDGQCVGDLPYEETYVLRVHGKVCSPTRSKLKESFFANTIKILHNDWCLDIPNCRSNLEGLVTSTTPRYYPRLPPIFLPVPDEDDNDADDADDDGNDGDDRGVNPPVDDADNERVNPEADPENNEDNTEVENEGAVVEPDSGVDLDSESNYPDTSVSEGDRESVDYSDETPDSKHVELGRPSDQELDTDTDHAGDSTEVISDDTDTDTLVPHHDDTDETETFLPSDSEMPDLENDSDYELQQVDGANDEKESDHDSNTQESGVTVETTESEQTTINGTENVTHYKRTVIALGACVGLIPVVGLCIYLCKKSRKTIKKKKFKTSDEDIPMGNYDILENVQVAEVSSTTPSSEESDFEESEAEIEVYSFPEAKVVKRA